MKIQTHLEKIDHLESSLAKLDDDPDHEAVIELIVLLAAQYVNASMHELDTLRIDKDIKHNRMYQALIREKRLRNDGNIAWEAFDTIEKLRSRHVYGSGTNGENARVARKQYEIIKSICRRILNV